MAAKRADKKGREAKPAEAPPDRPPSPRRHAAFEGREDRVQYIADLMASMLWVTRETEIELAEEWGLDRSTIRHYATEASRSLRAMLGNREDVALRAVVGLERLARERHASPVPGDASAAVKAYELLLKFGGLDKPETGSDEKGGPVQITIVEFPSAKNEDSPGANPGGGAPSDPAG